MNPTLRLMWKEYRALRGFWISLAVFGLLCDGLIFMFVADPRDRLLGLFGLVGVLPVLFSLGAGATLFAQEREEATRDFLRCLPLSSLRVFAGKILMALGGTLLLTLLMAAVSLAFGETTMLRLVHAGGFTGAMLAAAIYVVVMLQAMGWSVFFSLRSARPLVAAILGTVGAFASTIAAFFLAAIVRATALAWGFDRWRMTPPNEAFMVVIPFAIAAIWLVDVRIGARWLEGRRAVTRDRSDVRRAPRMSRLLWQEWRRSYRLLGLLLAIGIVLPSLSADPRSTVGTTAAVLALLGACTFLGDQERSQYRFFAERGVPARTVWFCRETFWGSAALLIAAGLFLLSQLSTLAIGKYVLNRVPSSAWSSLRFLLPWFALDFEGDRDIFMLLQQVAGYCVWTSLAFGAGQLSSMFFRSGLVAAVFGVILAGVLLLWAALMQIIAIGWWWSVAPLVIALFAATWVRASGWILDRRRAWVWPALVLAVPALSVLIAAPLYRVLAVPDTKLKRDALPAVVVSSEAIEAVGRALVAGERLAPGSNMNLQDLTDTIAQDDGHVLRYQSRLEDVIDALSQLPATAGMRDAAAKAVIDWQRVAALVIRYGQLAESRGELAQAWKRYHAALNLARFLRRQSAQAGEMAGDPIERAVLLQLPRWGAQKEQSAEQLTAALDDLRALDQQDQRLADVMWREYDYRRESMDEQLKQPERSDPRLGLIGRWAPWEMTRARRLLRYFASLSLLDAAEADSFFAGGPNPNIDVLRLRNFRDAQALSETTIFQPLLWARGVIEERRMTLCFRRATQLLLALEVWQIEDGEQPAILSELDNKYLHTSLLDPYSGQRLLCFPWGLRVAIRSTNHPWVPAGTPLVYSQGPRATLGEYAKVSRLERKSADEPVAESAEPMRGAAMAAGGMAGGAAPAPSMFAAVPAASPDLLFLGEAVQTPQVEQLDGLVFPIPTLKNHEDAASEP